MPVAVVQAIPAAAAVVGAFVALLRWVAVPAYRAIATMERVGREFTPDRDGRTRFDRLADDVAQIRSMLTSHLGAPPAEQCAAQQSEPLLGRLPADLGTVVTDHDRRLAAMTRIAVAPPARP